MYLIEELKITKDYSLFRKLEGAGLEDDSKGNCLSETWNYLSEALLHRYSKRNHCNSIENIYYSKGNCLAALWNYLHSKGNHRNSTGNIYHSKWNYVSATGICPKI